MKTMNPSSAVKTKFVEVLMIETCVVDVPFAKAFVKSPHIWRQLGDDFRREDEAIRSLGKLTTPLNTILRAKNI